jgi:15-cis-phytoene desaturase
MPKRVLVLGGGVAGLSAAHELVERGFEVEIHESKPVPGGKARTIYVPGSGTDGRPDLPGEHGFRFFPSFYKHLPDTMKRIPFARQPNGVYDNLVQASRYLVADGPKRNLRFLVRFPRSLAEWRELLGGIYQGRELGIPDTELLFFIERILIILSSCRERRLGEYEQIDWWRFIAADGKSKAYQTYLAIGLTRSLVALKAQEASTRTVGDILVQLLLGIYSPFTEFDRVLDGPTTEAWIDPWLLHLRARGVRFEKQSQVVALDCGADGRIHGVTVADATGARRSVHADYYVLALPVEAVVPLVDNKLAAAEPRLGRLHELRIAWMNGLQLFLRRDRSIVGGHANYVETPSALTSISQDQFWRRKLTDYGDGNTHGCLSIDISDWETPGLSSPPTPLKDLPTRADVMRDVRAQLQAALAPADAAALDDANLAAWFLDPDIELPNPSGAVNLEPLLINTRGSWADRPDATTKIHNLFLAADYVRTYTDLATMEGANEAARRAVNGILAAARASAAPCRLWPLHEPAIFAPARALDFILWKLGRAHGGLGRATTRELVAQPAIARHSRTHRVADAAQAAPAAGYQSMRKR